MYSDPFQEHIHKEEYSSFRCTYKELFEHIQMRKNNIFKIGNYLPAILSNQIYNTNRGKAVELLSSDYWYSTEIKTTQRQKKEQF